MFKTLALGIVIVGLALPAARAAEPRRDVVLGMVLEPPGLDPTLNAAAAIREVTYLNIYEGLTRIDANGAVQPNLADSWVIADDGLSYRFALRQGVSFHDGAPFTSADVKFTLDRARGPNSTNPQKQLFDAIASVETPDPATVVVGLKRPTGTLLYNLAWGDAVILSERSIADDATRPIGTGPFRFERWARGERIELVRNPAYRDKGVPAMDRVTFRFIADPQAAAAALRAGDVDGFANLGAPEAFAEFKKDPRFAAVEGSTEGKVIMSLNNGRKPFADRRVRRALTMAIDRAAVVEGAYAGFGRVIGSHCTPSDPAFIDLSARYPFNPAEARRLLAEAGLPDGFAMTLKLPPPAYARRSGEVIAAMLGEIGVRVTIEPIEFAPWLDQVFKRRDYDATIIAHVEPRDIGIYARDDYYFDYHNPAFQSLMTEYDRTIDPGYRIKLYGDAQRILAEDAVNVFLFALPKLGVWDKRLEGLWTNAPIVAFDVTRAAWR